MSFPDGTRAFAGSKIDSNLLILTGDELVVDRVGCRIPEDVVEKTLMVQFTFPCRTADDFLIDSRWSQ